MRRSTSFKRIFAALVLTLAPCALAASAQRETVEAREIDLKNCLSNYALETIVIRDRAAFLQAVRDDDDAGRCRAALPPIDFEKETLVGAVLDTGYCGRPPLEPVRAARDDAEKRLLVTIGYEEPRVLCRALSRYELWLLVPRLPLDYAVRVERATRPRAQK